MRNRHNLKILREAYSGFFSQEGLTILRLFRGGEAKTPPKRIYFTSPKNEDLRNISLGLHFCILTDLRVVENVTLKILREAYSGFFFQEGLTFLLLFLRGGGQNSPEKNIFH